MINIVIDTIGGDNGAAVCVSGAIEGLKQNPDVKLFLTGHKAELESYLTDKEYDASRLEIIDCEEEIGLNEPPVHAVREKKKSSLVVGLKLVKDGKADALISAGSTGAILAGGQFVVGRAKGVKRTPLAHLLPTSKEPSLLLDCGANVDVKPEVLVKFVEMGSIYMESVCEVKRPRVALVNVGTEEEKGNALVKETFPLLKACKDINFIGSVEARDVTAGAADIVVCEAFVGNVLLKSIEGVGRTMIKMIKSGLMSSFKSKMGALLIKPALKKTLKAFDVEEYGGAPMLGLNGLVVKTHGSSKAVEIKNSVLQCIAFKEQRINEKIKAKISTEE